jgi:hypothetical protein
MTRRIRFEPVLEFTSLCYDRLEDVFSVIAKVEIWNFTHAAYHSPFCEATGVSLVGMVCRPSAPPTRTRRVFFSRTQRSSAL